MRLLPRTLRARLFLALLIAFIPVIALLASARYEFVRKVEADTQREIVRLASIVVQSHQRLISDTKYLLDALAKTPEIQNVAQPTCDRILTLLNKQDVRYANLVVIALDGEVKCSGKPLDRPVNLGHRNHIRKAIETRGWVVGEVVFGLTTASLILPVATAIVSDSGALLGVVAAAVDLDYLTGYVRELDLPEQSLIMLHDHTGRILLRHPHAEQFVGKEVTQWRALQAAVTRGGRDVLKIVGLDGILRLVTVSQLQDASGGTPVYLQVGIPTDAFSGGMMTTLSTVAVNVLLILIATFGILWIGTDRHLLRSLADLGKTAKLLASGDLTARSELKHGPVELIELSRVLDEMASTVQKRQRELDQQKLALDDHAIVSIADAAGSIIYANDKFSEISQYSREELLGRNHNVINSGFHPPEFFREMWKTIQSGNMWHGQIRNRCKDGSFYWVATTIVPFKDLDGQIYQYVSIRTDITYLKRTEAVLRQHQQHLEELVRQRTADLVNANRELELDVARREEAEHALQDALVQQKNLGDQQKAILNALPANIALLDSEGNIIGVNESWRRFARRNGWRNGNYALGMNYLAQCDSTRGGAGADQAGAAAAGIRSLLKGEVEFFDLEYPCHSPHEDRWFKLHAAPLLPGALAGAVVMHIDITERMRSELSLKKSYADLQQTHTALEQTQLQLVHADKMASIGQLSAGVAHEINNPIGYVSSNLNALQRDVRNIFAMLAEYETTEPSLPDEQRERLRQARSRLQLDHVSANVRDCIAESRQGIDRVREIVQALREFSHVDSMHWQWVDQHAGLDSTLKIVHNEIKHKAEIVKHYGDLPLVECVPSQINQVFLNLLVNAAQAIEQRGTITISTGVADNGAWVEIADTGRGIPPDELPRIFDPFFTTKPVGAGTGLGLSLSYTIVKRHHGNITVRSEVGHGTTFRVWLPERQSNNG